MLGKSLKFDRYFKLFCNHECFIKLNYASSPGRTVRMIAKIRQSFGLLLRFESFKSMKNAWCSESLNVRTIFWLTQYSVNADFYSVELFDWTRNPLFTCEIVAVILNFTHD